MIHPGDRVRFTVRSRLGAEPRGLSRAMRQQSRGPGRTLFERMSALAGGRADRFVIDDPRAGEPERTFVPIDLDSLPDGAVVVMSRLSPLPAPLDPGAGKIEATRYCARCDKAVPIVHNCPECKGPVF